MDQAEHAALVEKALHFSDGLPGLPEAEPFVIGGWVPSMFFPAFARVLSDLGQTDLKPESADRQFALSPGGSLLNHTRRHSTCLDPSLSTQRRESGDSRC